VTLVEGMLRACVKITLAIPPGMDPMTFQQQIGQGGISVAMGLLPYVKEVGFELVDVPIAGGPALVS